MMIAVPTTTSSCSSTSAARTMSDSEAATSLADVRRYVVRVSQVTPRPRETRRQSQNVLVGPQRILFLPAVHTGINDRDMFVRVKQNVLTALVGRVNKLKRQSAGRCDADVRQEPVPVAVGHHQMVLENARVLLVEWQCSCSNDGGAAGRRSCCGRANGHGSDGSNGDEKNTQLGYEG